LCVKPHADARDGMRQFLRHSARATSTGECNAVVEVPI
jgi:hypothetical protein